MAEIEQKEENGETVICMNHNGVVRKFIVPLGSLTSQEGSGAVNLPPIASSAAPDAVTRVQRTTTGLHEKVPHSNPSLLKHKTKRRSDSESIQSKKTAKKSAVPSFKDALATVERIATQLKKLRDEPDRNLSKQIRPSAFGPARAIADELNQLSSAPKPRFATTPSNATIVLDDEIDKQTTCSSQSAKSRASKRKTLVIFPNGDNASRQPKQKRKSCHTVMLDPDEEDDIVISGHTISANATAFGKATTNNSMVGPSLARLAPAPQNTTVSFAAGQFSNSNNHTVLASQANYSGQIINQPLFSNQLNHQGGALNQPIILNQAGVPSNLLGQNINQPIVLGQMENQTNLMNQIQNQPYVYLSGGSRPYMLNQMGNQPMIIGQQPNILHQGGPQTMFLGANSLANQTVGLNQNLNNQPIILAQNVNQMNISNPSGGQSMFLGSPGQQPNVLYQAGAQNPNQMIILGPTGAQPQSVLQSGYNTVLGSNSHIKQEPNSTNTLIGPQGTFAVQGNAGVASQNFQPVQNVYPSNILGQPLKFGFVQDNPAHAAGQSPIGNNATHFNVSQVASKSTVAQVERSNEVKNTVMFQVPPSGSAQTIQQGTVHNVVVSNAGQNLSQPAVQTSTGICATSPTSNTHLKCLLSSVAAEQNSENSSPDSIIPTSTFWSTVNKLVQMQKENAQTSTSTPGVTSTQQPSTQQPRKQKQKILPKPVIDPLALQMAVPLYASSNSQTGTATVASAAIPSIDPIMAVSHSSAWPNDQLAKFAGELNSNITVAHAPLQSIKAEVEDDDDDDLIVLSPKSDSGGFTSPVNKDTPTSVQAANNSVAPNMQMNPAEPNDQGPFFMQDLKGAIKKIFGFTYLNNVRHAVVESDSGFVALPLPEGSEKLLRAVPVPQSVATAQSSATSTIPTGTSPTEALISPPRNLTKLAKFVSQQRRPHMSQSSEAHLDNKRHSSKVLQQIIEKRKRGTPVVLLHNLNISDHTSSFKNHTLHDTFYHIVKCKSRRGLFEKFLLSDDGRAVVTERNLCGGKVETHFCEGTYMRMLKEQHLNKVYDDDTDIDDDLPDIPEDFPEINEDTPQLYDSPNARLSTQNEDSIELIKEKNEQNSLDLTMSFADDSSDDTKTPDTNNDGDGVKNEFATSSTPNGDSKGLHIVNIIQNTSMESPPMLQKCTDIGVSNNGGKEVPPTLHLYCSGKDCKDCEGKSNTPEKTTPQSQNTSTNSENTRPANEETLSDQQCTTYNQNLLTNTIATFLQSSAGTNVDSFQYFQGILNSFAKRPTILPKPQ